jgi:hypothetical protein
MHDVFVLPSIHPHRVVCICLVAPLEIDELRLLQRQLRLLRDPLTILSHNFLDKPTYLFKTRCLMDVAYPANTPGASADWPWNKGGGREQTGGGWGAGEKGQRSVWESGTVRVCAHDFQVCPHVNGPVHRLTAAQLEVDQAVDRVDITNA